MRSTTTGWSDSITVENSAVDIAVMVFGFTVTRVWAGTSTVLTTALARTRENVSVAVVAIVPGLRRASCVLKKDDVAPSAR